MNRPRGIHNNGNDCFINVVLQCLAVSPFMINFIEYYNNNDIKLFKIINKYELSKYKSNEINIECDKILKNNENIPAEDIDILTYISKYSNVLYIYISLKEIIKNLNNGNIDPIKNIIFISMNKEISEYYGFDYLFNGDQNDPHELITYLLDKIHDSKKTKIQISEPKNITSLDLYTKLFYENYKKRYENDYSLFVKNYYYYILSCVKCIKCDNTTNNVTPSDILCVSIPDIHIPSEIETNIYDCLNDMFKVENIQYKCEHCKNDDNNIIEKKIMNIPKTLIIKIKRYYSNGKRLVKNNKFIKYPLTLDMEPYIISENSQKYELYAIINHSGVLDSGHYYSFVKKYNSKTNKFGNQWFCCNDSNVTEINIKEVLSSQYTYILFYHYIS